MKKLQRNLFILVGVCFFFAIILGEIIIRIFPFSFARYLKLSEITLQKDRDLGFIYTPFQKTFLCTECFYNPLFTTNSLGFRGPEWDLKDNFAIGILGDSNLAAEAVGEDSHLSFIMEKLLKKKVINTGVRGYGTFAELMAYKKFLQPLHPKVVILVFTKCIDIIESSCKLLTRFYSFKSQPCGYFSDGQIKIDTNLEYSASVSNKNNFKTKARDFIYKYLWSVKVGYRFIVDIFLKIIYYKDSKEKIFIYNKIFSDKDKIWQEAWQILEHALAQLKKEVESDGSRFLVVFLAEYPEFLDKRWERVADKYKQICRRYEISFLDTFGDFQKFKEKWQLKKPYFSYWCDPHYNPLGYFLLANLIARHLITEGWISLNPEENNQILQRIEKNLNLSPKEILSDAGYRQIYHHKVFLGKTNISKILNDN